MTPSASPPWANIYAAVALTTLATLLVELALTRIFSVVFFYHLAFMAISLALFGLGAGAVFSYYLAGRRGSGSVWSQLGGISTLNVVATPAALVVVLQQQVSIEVSWGNALKLTLTYFVSAVPFFLTGVVLCSAISATLARVDRVYFYDLLGAGCACILLIPLLDWAGGPNTVVAAAALYGAAGALWYRAANRPRQALISFLLFAAMGILVLVNARTQWVDVRFAKGQALGQEIFARWNSFSRVAVKPDDGAGSRAIVIDADAATSVPSVSPEDWTDAARAQILRSGPGLPYRIRPRARALIIGPGGGYDVARALASGSPSVTGVEINPIIVNDIMKNHLAAYSRHLYSRPEVEIHIEDGRSFVRRSRRKFEIIQMTLVDTWASTAAGAFALSENNLYTTEAFLDYFEDLTDDGVLAITRWEFDPPRESLRVVSLAVEALRRLGAAEPWRHFLVCRESAQDLTGYGAKDTVVVKRTPLTGEEIDRARQAMAEAGMPTVYLPDEEVPNPFTELLRSPDPGEYARKYQYDITPVSDNRPFFFYTVRARELWEFVTLRRSEDVKINLGVMMLIVLLGVSLAGTALILLLPPLLLGTRLPRDRLVFLHLAYFFAIGAGFILVEVSLIQKFVLFLGSPTYSLTVVVFSLLVSSAVGSYASRRLIGQSDRRLALALAGVAILVGAFGLLVPPLLQAGVGLALAAKCVVSAAAIFPVGFAMGMPFPCGLKRLENSYPAAIRWAWAMNSASSVLGSVAAVFFAIYLGLAQTLLLGAAGYLLALFVVRLTGASGPPPIAAANAARGIL